MLAYNDTALLRYMFLIKILYLLYYIISNILYLYLYENLSGIRIFSMRGFIKRSSSLSRGSIKI